MDLNKGAPVTARPLSIVREQTLSPARGGSLGHSVRQVCVTGSSKLQTADLLVRPRQRVPHQKRSAGCPRQLLLTLAQPLIGSSAVSH